MTNYDFWAKSKQFKVNMIHLATISGRVPIIPPFGPGAHICELFQDKHHFLFPNL